MAITASSITNTDSPNVTRFPSRATYSSFLPDKEKNDHTVYNNYYYIRAREHIENDVNLVEIAEMYHDVMGRPMPRFVEHEVMAMLQTGIQPDMVCAVLAYTGGAPRPSWVYARTVIEKQAGMGARTAADFHGNVGRWRSSRAASGGKRVIEQQYEQRQCSADDDGIPADLLEEATR